MRRTPASLAAAATLAAAALSASRKSALADGVHQVIHHVDGPASAQRRKCRLRRHGVGGIEVDRCDVVEPAEALETRWVSGGGHHLVAVRQQRRDQARSHIAGGTGDQNPHIPDPSPSTMRAAKRPEEQAIGRAVPTPPQSRPRLAVAAGTAPAAIGECTSGHRHMSSQSIRTDATYGTVTRAWTRSQGAVRDASD